MTQPALHNRRSLTSCAFRVCISTADPHLQRGVVEHHVFGRDRDVKLLRQDLGTLGLSIHAVVGDKEVGHAAVMHLAEGLLGIGQDVPATDQDACGVAGTRETVVMASG